MKFKNDNICDIVKDLLPLYADNACNESSKQLVEEHIKTCTDCAQTLDLMKQPIKIENNSAAKAGAVKKATRKLKLRTIIIFVLIIAIAIPPAFSFVNWCRGDGICFSNTDEIKAGKALMESWKNDGFESAVNECTPDYLYKELCKEDHYFTKNPQDYTQKEIQGRPYYAYKDIFEENYIYGKEEYLQNFWYNIITDTIWYYIIPADIYEGLEQEYGEDFYKERKSGLDQSVPKKITTEFGDFYFNYDEQNDVNVYDKYYRTVDFRDKVQGVYELSDLFYIVERCDILTPELYDYYCRIYNDTVKWDTEYTQYYKDLGLDGFTNQWRNDLLNYMADYKTLKLTSYKLTDIYQATGEKEWNMIFNVEFSNGACGNVYVLETETGYCFGGGYPAERESEKTKDFFYRFSYIAKDNYYCHAPYEDL